MGGMGNPHVFLALSQVHFKLQTSMLLSSIYNLCKHHIIGTAGFDLLPLIALTKFKHEINECQEPFHAALMYIIELVLA